MDSFRQLAAYGALPAISAIGFFGTMIVGRKNGLTQSLLDVVRGKTTSLPNTNATVIRNWTGIRFIDDYLAFYIAFFLPSFGKKNSTTMLQNRHFIGQFAAMWALLQLQGLRPENNRVLRASLPFFAFGIQSVGAATFVPLFCAAHLASSTFTNIGSTGGIANLSEARVNGIPIAVLLGIVLPLASASFLKSNRAKQTATVVFQVYFIFTELIERLIGQTITPAASAGPLSLPLTRVYAFAEILSAITHLSVFGTVLAAQVAPGSFPKGYAEQTSLSRLFVPRVKQETEGDLFEARLNFLRWDEAATCSSLLLWATVCYTQVLPSQALTLPVLGKLGAEVVLRVLLTGPVGAVAHLLRQRDILALQH